ncbi:flagellar biosynthesis protein [Aequitasia blattaphilus]|uniref:EscU/YscU/HrcU family type III secretion system export apparatus switch protein n=1 Tax=Aequitasia blattaphilus TaxID=2949332 RepID=A0ABT1E9I5_9FIRM|nr:EscU/YscU/HrcU family type III secretion system export apparatus switch protein [Aequitasia blattaphilus]MCP1102496.1 EscU/YscU/HrcU family type III secretion system export apparatus switch protein [Aequitasia blattaphilus]MCR8615136.1 EscU/YscU/HrcU family type III secretion system export apparatus switch protein [Aequitasia blattaphilus]
MSEYNSKQKAIALSYDEENQAAPVVVASGMGFMAEEILKVAEEAGVPVYEDNSLATLLTQLELGMEIPEELYQVVIDIYMYFLNFKSTR